MDTHSPIVEKSAPSKADSCEPVLRGGLDMRWLLPVVLALVATLAYLASQSWSFVAGQLLPWHEWSLAVLFLLCTGYLLFHGLGFLRDVLRRLLPAIDVGNPSLHRPPSAAVLVLGCGGPTDLLEQTLNSCRNLEYPNKQIYLLDDVPYDIEAAQTPEMTACRREIEEMCKRLEVCLFRGNRRAGKAGILNDFLDFVAGRGNPGSVSGDPSGASRPPAPDFLAVCDAGMILQPDVLGGRVEQMQRNSRLAVAQFLEDYTNLAASRVVRADALHETVFRRVIGEGRIKRMGMMCRDANAFFRRSALESVGGFDDGRLTAAFAVSSKFSRRGWRSVFVNRTGVSCKGPEGLGSYFTRQFHQALGATGILCSSLRQLFRLPPGPGWFRTAGQALSATRCFFGWVFLVLCLMPVLFIFLGLPGLLAAPGILLGVLCVYAVLGASVFFLSSQEPRCSPGDLLAGIVLPAVAFPAYCRATFAAMTRKGGCGEAKPAEVLPLSALWPQTALLVLSFSAVVWAANRWWFTHEDGLALFLNSLWCLCNVIVLSVVYYLNQPEES